MEEDERIPEDKRAANLITTIANLISEMITVREDVPTNHPSERIPILEVWVHENKIYYYKKLMVSKKGMHFKSLWSQN